MLTNVNADYCSLFCSVYFNIYFSLLCFHRIIPVLYLTTVVSFLYTAFSLELWTECFVETEWLLSHIEGLI